MKWLQGTHTQRFNARHQVFGHLFQGRYKAPIMDPVDAGYVQLVSTYIHLNQGRRKPDNLAGTIQIERVRHRMADLGYYEKLKFWASTGGEPNGASGN